MNEVTFNGQYADFKNILDVEIKEAAAGFVRIGYLLKVARDTDILKDSGYTSVAEFAKAEYGLTKDIVSRYIAINDRFSEGGYSDMLQMKFTGYGVAKLAEMLTLPEELAEQLPAEMTRKEIQEIKKEYAEEKNISDLEVMMEQPGPSLDNNLAKALYEYFRIEENYKRLHETELIEGYGWRKDEMLEVVAPEGMANIRVRIPAFGRVMIVIDEQQDDIILTNMRTLAKESFSWDDMAAVLEAFHYKFVSFAEAYFAMYKERIEEKQEVAPMQQEPEPVNVANLVEKTEPEESTEEEQIPGQMEVTDYPELMPESTYEEVENVDSNADETEEHGAGNFDGMSAGSGNDVDAVESGNDSGMGRSEVQSNDEGSGAAESGGCKGDYEDREPADETEHWREAEMHLERVKEFMKLRNFGAKVDTVIVKSMYKDAVSLAAAFESILNMRTEDEE